MAASDEELGGVRTEAGRLVTSNVQWFADHSSMPKEKLKCLHGVKLDRGCERCG